MPEGDTIHRIAAALGETLPGKPVEAVELPRLPHSTRDLIGRTVERVEARGKHLLVFFDEGTVLHTHLMMSGSWHLYRTGETWRRPRSAMRAFVRVAGWEAVCFLAPTVRLMTARQFATDRRLRSLGPDPLRENFDANEVLSRLRALEDVPLGVAVMDQRALVGVGNVFKSELLFNLKLDPFAPVSAFSDDELKAVIAHAAELLRLNVAVRREPGTHPAAHYDYVRRTRLNDRPGRARSVYGRKELGCYDCGTAIERALQGEQQRSTYWCPRCQLRRMAEGARAR